MPFLWFLRVSISGGLYFWPSSLTPHFLPLFVFLWLNTSCISSLNCVPGDFFGMVETKQELEVAWGMIFLGLVSSSILYGITLMQTYKYYQRFPNDHLFIKWLVAAVCILDTLSACLVTHASWFYLVDSGSLKVSVWSLNAELVVSMMISGISECFMAYRVWKFSNKFHALTIGILFLALLHFTSGEVSAIQFFISKKFAVSEAAKVPGMIRLGSAAVCDATIAISLCYFLEQKRTGYKRTDKIIDSLVLYSINTGALTGISSVACLITYITIPKTWLYLALCFLISRLYSNTFLSTLNSRQILFSEAESDVDPVVVPPFQVKKSNRAFLTKSRSGKGPKQIDVYVVRETISDGLDINLDGCKDVPETTNEGSRRLESSDSESSLERTDSQPASLG